VQTSLQEAFIGKSGLENLQLRLLGYKGDTPKNLELIALSTKGKSSSILFSSLSLYQLTGNSIQELSCRGRETDPGE
jgi:hypothetical protein